jgi:hypothetical protein
MFLNLNHQLRTQVMRYYKQRYRKKVQWDTANLQRIHKI